MGRGDDHRGLIPVERREVARLDGGRRRDVCGETGGETRGSLRANQRFWEATKIHLGTDVAATIAKEGGVGGGHPTAASFTCSLPEDKAAETTLNLVASLLKDKVAEIR